MKKFYLQRNEDLSGVSGIGIVAEGVEFSDGTAVIRWLGDKSSTGVYASVRELIRIHGHEGKTIIVWAKDKKSSKRKDNTKEFDVEKAIKDITDKINKSPNPYAPYIPTPGQQEPYEWHNWRYID